MIKRTLFATVVIFITWSIMDFVIHAVLLDSTYHTTAHLWRTESEMNMSLMSAVTFIFSICFASIYSFLIKPKSLLVGIKFGILLGLATGVSMGFGSYSYMPIPLSLAFSWFVGSLVELSVAGVIVGLMIKSSDE